MEAFYSNKGEVKRSYSKHILSGEIGAGHEIGNEMWMSTSITSVQHIALNISRKFSRQGQNIKI